MSFIELPIFCAVGDSNNTLADLGLSNTIDEQDMEVRMGLINEALIVSVYPSKDYNTCIVETTMDGAYSIDLPYGELKNLLV